MIYQIIINLFGIWHIKQCDLVSFLNVICKLTADAINNHLDLISVSSRVSSKHFFWVKSIEMRQITGHKMQ